MNIANSGGEDRTRQTVYAAPVDVPLDDFALDGRWLAAAEYVRHAAEAKPPGDSVALHYRAKSVYLVAGSDDSKARRLYVAQDGKPLSKAASGVDVRAANDGRTYLELGAKRMYYVVNNGEFGGHLLQTIRDGTRPLALFVHLRQQLRKQVRPSVNDALPAAGSVSNFYFRTFYMLPRSRIASLLMIYE